MIETLNIAAKKAQDNPHGVLDEHSWLGVAIDEDSAAGRFGLWGTSTVIDENTRTAVVSPVVFAALHARAEITAQWPVGNAGLLHVYGYLLSSVPTPHGLKRERWLNGALARAYGFADDEFVPWARSQTLLQRVSGAATQLLAHDAIRTWNGAGGESALSLRRASNNGPWALAYSVNHRLATTFSVESPNAVLVEWDADPARVRWNAVT